MMEKVRHRSLFREYFDLPTMGRNSACQWPRYAKRTAYDAAYVFFSRDVNPG